MPDKSALAVEIHTITCVYLHKIRPGVKTLQRQRNLFLTNYVILLLCLGQTRRVLSEKDLTLFKVQGKIFLSG